MTPPIEMARAPNGKPRALIPFAKAAAEAWHGHPVDSRFLTDPATGGSGFFDVAAAVLQALRNNVSPEMIEAGAKVTLEWCTKRDRIAGSDAARIFTAMLDAAGEGA